MGNTAEEKPTVLVLFGGEKVPVIVIHVTALQLILILLTITILALAAIYLAHIYGSDICVAGIPFSCAQTNGNSTMAGM